MMRRSLYALGLSALLLGGALAQQMPTAPAPSQASGPIFDTSYQPSPSVTARLQRKFLQDLRWSSGIPARDAVATAFAERSPVDIWQELVAPDGLSKNNLTDALAAYWVLNWITANGAYRVRIDHEPVQRQVAEAFANDAAFQRYGDHQKQALAEGYILNFLVEHAALNDAVKRGDTQTLYKLAVASIGRFQQNMGVNLLALEPGPNGFGPRQLNQQPNPTPAPQ